MVPVMTNDKDSFMLVCPNDLDLFAGELTVEDLLAKMKVVRIVEDADEVVDDEQIEFGCRHGGKMC